MSTHFFEISDAEKHGVEKAVIIFNLRYWLNKNKANRSNSNDGYYWTYNSSSAFAELFPYWSASKIKRMLRQLEEDGVIRTGNFNNSTYDRTKWYTMEEFKITEEVKPTQPKPTKIVTQEEQEAAPTESESLYALNDERVIKLWNSLGCEQLKGITAKTRSTMTATYKKYLKTTSTPKPLAVWLETYLIKGFKPTITNLHRKFDDGQWAADLEYAVRFATYDKVKNLAH